MKKHILLIFTFLFFSFSLSYATVINKKDFVAYLFSYFTGNSGDEESIRFAISVDGFNYFALNNNQPVLQSKEISSTGGVRDPHILRGEDGKTFYMVVTDMVTAKGWDSNRGLILLKSENLVDWTHHIINIQDKYAGHEDLKRVWAPQTIYDRNAEKYMVYFSMKHGNGEDILYYAYVNDDFSDFIMEPKPLYIPENKKSCIDADIIFKDDEYHLFYKKTEDNKSGLRKATSHSLTAGLWKENDQYLEQTTDAVEGSSIFQLINSDTHILMYDVYGRGRYEFTESTNLTDFTLVPSDKISMDFKPRHGTVIPITREELYRVMDKWGSPKNLEGIPNNPVIPGYHADPDIIYSQNTGKYYMYPTSDGYTGWSGDYFKIFSSDDLKIWKEENVILDFKKDVPWAYRNAWAPTAIEVKQSDGTYKYFFYYTGQQQIGVAYADYPTGPYKDLGKPLVSLRPEGVRGGQVIDPAVFRDPQSGKHFLYWGNGFCVVAELNEDMVSIKEGTEKVITPDNTFREAIYVIYRKGTYYFLWSENDTRSEDYRVRYGTSKSPYGPIEVPEDNLILQKDATKGIYGTGHNSVIQIPGKDEWYIVYHRFNRPDGIHMGSAAGYHREVCIDPLFFDKKGKIKKVVPSL